MLLLQGCVGPACPAETCRFLFRQNGMRPDEFPGRVGFERRAPNATYSTVIVMIALLGTMITERCAVLLVTELTVLVAATV